MHITKIYWRHCESTYSKYIHFGQILFGICEPCKMQVYSHINVNIERPVFQWSLNLKKNKKAHLKIILLKWYFPIEAQLHSAKQKQKLKAESKCAVDSSWNDSVSTDDMSDMKAKKELPQWKQAWCFLISLVSGVNLLLQSEEEQTDTTTQCNEMCFMKLAIVITLTLPNTHEADPSHRHVSMLSVKTPFRTCSTEMDRATLNNTTRTWIR